MKTQISRNGYRREKRYSGVYQQQGRLITDSDWNELVDTFKERVDEALVDVVGSGSPKGRAALIQMAGTTPKIVPGVVYAGGIEGRVVSAPGVGVPFDLSQQADFPAPPPLSAPGTAYRIYADVWDRHVGPLEDDGLRDPALHGADTCTRSQTLVQVKWCPVAKNPEAPADNPVQGDARLTLKYPQGGSQAGADPCDPKAQEVDPVGGDFLFRVEIHDARWQANVAPTAPDRVVVKWSRENGAEQYAFADMPDWFKTGSWIYELYDADSEKHLGFHLATGNWTPKRGTLVTALPQIAPAGTMVRRWEGYTVLVRSGSVWSVSSANAETTADTAGGATVQVSGGAVTVTLADLELSLELLGKVLLPGDFWATPVRRATYEAGKKLLDNAPSSGIVHRYVTLAEVLTNNTLKPRTAQEQRKLAFPRLSELDAADMGYSTTCTSGLYDATHDTVKKALDRLCAINGTHVGYTKPSDTSVFKGNNPATVAQALNLLADVQSDDIGYVTTCTSGLYDGTHDTVKKALDRLCAIDATHVGFTKPSDTSVFKGATPVTVAQALNLLANVKSDQISYSPAQFPQIQEVKTALDELFDRPQGNGNMVTVGDGGQFATVDVALAALAPVTKNIALALMPGDHPLPAGWDSSGLNGAHVSITGLGGATRLLAFQSQTTIGSTASFRLEKVHVLFSQGAYFLFTDCGDLRLVDNVFESSHSTNVPQLWFAPGTGGRGQNVLMRNNVLDGQWEIADPYVVAVLALDTFANIANLFQLNITEFRKQALQLATALMAVPFNDRSSIGIGIQNRANANVNLTSDERAIYVAIANQLFGLSGQVTILFGILENLRRFLYLKSPGLSVMASTGGSFVLEGNQMNGVIGFNGQPASASNLIGKEAIFVSMAQNGKFIFSSPTPHSLHASNNVLAGIRGGQSTIDGIRLATNNPSQSHLLFTTFHYMSFVDNEFLREDNHFIAEQLTLSGNYFNRNSTYVGWALAQSGIYVGNRGRIASTRLYNGMLPGNAGESANIRFALAYS